MNKTLCFFLRLRFTNYAAVIGVLFIFIQQIIVASSTAFIALLSKNIISGENYIFFLILFIISLTIAYIPTMLTNYFINKATYLTYKEYILKFSKQSYNHPNIYFNAKFREKKEPYFTHEAWLIIQEDYYYIVTIFSIVLNIILNVLVLGFYLNWNFLFSYIFAVPLTLICVIISKKRLLKKSDNLQKSRNEMMQTLSYGWDTILIGNKWNNTLWNNIFKRKCDEADKNQRKLTLEIDVMAIITLIVSAFPILFTLFISFLNAGNDIQKLAMLVATTPRQVITIQNLSDIISLFVNLNDKIHRTKKLSENLNINEDLLVPDNKITWGNIFIANKKGKTVLNSFSDLLSATKNFEKGRYTITGDNGTGKTTLLANIKFKMDDKAYLLPSHSKMMFQNDTNEKGYSTGEKLHENFKEISSVINDGIISILLLDEWNANLDKENLSKVNQEIEEISKIVCVIEVLHISNDNHS